MKSTKAPPVKKRTSPSNKFLEALDQIERAVYEAQAAGSRYHYSTRRLKNIKANIKLATQKRNYLFARQSLGHGIYSAMQLAKKIGRKRRTATSSAVKTFMDSIQKAAWSFYVWHLHECKWRCHPYVCSWWHWKYGGWHTGSQRYRKIHCSSWKGWDRWLYFIAF